MFEVAGSATLSGNRLIRGLIKLVDDLDLDRRDFVIFGSGPLLAHGLRSHVSDLDIVARGAAWHRALASGEGCLATGAINGAPMVTFCEGEIQFSSGWITEAWDPDDLIDRAETVEGLPFAPLADVLEYKQILRRPKDLPDIKALLDVLNQPAGPN